MLFEKEKIQKAYEDSVLNESSEIQVKTAIEKIFPVKVKKVDVKRKIVFELSSFIDNEDFDNIGKMDAIEEFIKKKFKNSIVSFNGYTIEVEEL